MAGRVAGKIKLQSVDELLGVPEIAGTQEIELGRIHAFPNHPFKVLDDDKMETLVDSIRENGILNPVIVRPDQTGNYEMISGHRRLHAAGIVGLKKIPAIVRVSVSLPLHHTRLRGNRPDWMIRESRCLMQTGSR